MRMTILMYSLLASEEDYDFYNTTDNIIIKMYGNNFKIDKNDNVIPYDDDDNDNNKPITIQSTQRQIISILDGYYTNRSIKEFTNQAKRIYKKVFPNYATCVLLIPLSPTEPMIAKNDNYGACQNLYHHWNNKRPTNPIADSTTALR